MKKNKTVIYTAIAGGIDNLVQHKYISKDFDYVCFSDRPIDDPGIWEIRLMKASQLDNVRRAKYYKLFPHELFSEYIYSIWVDGNIDLLDHSLEKRVLELIGDDVVIAANIHPQRNCVYEEANACIKMGKDEPELILQQVEFLRSVEFPVDMGLYEMGLVFRKHHDNKVVQLMNDWWGMITNFSRRDQLSFTYVLFKNNINCAHLFREDIRNSTAFSLKPHARAFYATLMVDTGTGFNYKNMIIQQFLTKEDLIIEMNFDLSNFSKIIQLRLSPFDTGVGRIKLMGIVLQSSDNHFINLDVKKIKSNGFLQEDGYTVFHTFDPILDILVNDWIEKIIISGVFKVESEMVGKKILSSSFERISDELERIHGSFVWKLREAILCLPRRLHTLLKIPPSNLRKH